jgi:ABC-type Fe3+/spermidine/putrescine transport system ATPase subunit
MLEVKGLSYKIGNFLLKDIDLDINENEYFVLLGRSGSGKTTLIKCISGLHAVTKGIIKLNGKNITKISPEYRNIAYLPQDYALFPHLDVKGNILFGIKTKKLNKSELAERLENFTRVLGIKKLLNRNVNNLSGGEKQKAALARALVIHPDVLLLDEPFSSIDHGLKVELWFELKEILKKLNIIVIHITHNLDEAHAVADKIAVLIDGRITQIGSKEEIFQRPRTEQVALFQGIKNIYEGRVADINGKKITVQNGEFKITALKEKNIGVVKDQTVKLCIRPQDIKIIKEGLSIRDELIDNVFEGEIQSSLFYNDFCTLKLKSIVDFELRFPVYIYQRYNFYTGKKILIGIWQPGINIFHE